MSTISSSLYSLSTPYGDDTSTTTEHVVIDDELMMLEEQTDEEQTTADMMFAECCAAVPAFNPPSAIVLTDDPSTSPVPHHQEPHLKDKQDDKVSSSFYSNRRCIIGVILLVIGGVTLLTAGIFFLRNRNVSSPSDVSFECQLLSSSCSNTTDMMTEALPICAMIEYKQLKIQLQDLTESPSNGPIESCASSNLALWQVAIDLHRQSNPTTIPDIMAAASTAAQSLSSVVESAVSDESSTNQDWKIPTAIWMNRFVVYTLYFSTGTPLPPPTDNDSTCLFDGVICNGQEDIMVLNLVDSLSGSGGPLPTELGLLSNSLRVLDLGSNSFTGTLPTELAQLKLLQTLSIEHNQLTGSLPTELSSLKRLKTLELGHNSFTGSVPALQLDDLDRLSLPSNNFQGKLPNSLSRSAFLWYVDVSDNQLTGTVDLFSLFNSDILSHLDLSYNSMLDIASSPQALDVGYFSELRGLSLSGIPIKENDIDFNQFLMTRMHLMPQLTHLHLAEMGWTGSLPPALFFQESTNLVYLDLSDNSFNGTIPEPSSDMPRFSLETLHLADNLLTGSIPSALASLEELSLDGNQFNGVLPQEICENIPVLEADFCRDLPVGAACFDDDNTGCRCFASC